MRQTTIMTACILVLSIFAYSCNPDDDDILLTDQSISQTSTVVQLRNFSSGLYIVTIEGNGRTLATKLAVTD